MFIEKQKSRQKSRPSVLLQILVHYCIRLSGGCIYFFSSHLFCWVTDCHKCPCIITNKTQECFKQLWGNLSSANIIQHEVNVSLKHPLNMWTTHFFPVLVHIFYSNFSLTLSSPWTLCCHTASLCLCNIFSLHSYFAYWPNQLRSRCKCINILAGSVRVSETFITKHIILSCTESIPSAG